MKKFQLGSSIFIVLISMFFTSCEKENITPGKLKNFIVLDKISTTYKQNCEVGYGIDTVVSYINFIPKDSTFTINAIKVFTKNSTIFPDSFIILKGFTWLDFKIICYPPRTVNGVKLGLEANGTVTCRLSDVVVNSKNTKYLDTISSVFELGRYDDVVNLIGYTKKQVGQNLKIHLPSVNNLGKNSLRLQYDTLGIDSGRMIGEITFNRSTPDSAINRFVIDYGFNNVCGDSYLIEFAENGNYTLTSPRNCIGLFTINSIIKNGNEYKIRFNRTLDGALVPLFYVNLVGYGHCSNNYQIISKKYYY